LLSSKEVRNIGDFQNNLRSRTRINNNGC